jgi:glycosyltransferase involved in cell wall biosynthesis
VVQRIAHVQRLPDRSGEPDSRDLSFVALFEGWPADLERFHSSAHEHVRCAWELVVVDNPVDPEASERIAALDRVLHLPLRDKVGYGAGRNLGLRQATGRIVCIIDTSVELLGDPWPPLDGALADPSVGLVGRWGVTTSNGFDFEASDGPAVDGVEGYLMAMRRADLPRIGSFDPKFRFYRNADLDLTYRVRAAGLRTIVDPSIPAIRHAHRLWESTPDRDDLSRRNFARFRRRWFSSQEG